jgi:hypothetical protein
LIRQLPKPDTLTKYLDDPEMLLSHARPPEDYRGQPPAMAAPEFSAELPEPVHLADSSRERILQAGIRAVEKVRDRGEDVDLDPQEMVGLEAIVLTEGRPAILIQDGHFFPPPIEWQVLEQKRDGIENTFKSVGRIEVNGHPSYEWVGTGFLVAEDVIMTNRHVANVFCRARGICKQWAFEPGMTAHIDYVEELGSLNSAEFALTSVIGVHDMLDMALFRAVRTSGQGIAAPEPLTIASHAADVAQGHRVYIVGYPAWDGRRNDPMHMRRIFSDIFNVKRLLPGEIMGVLPQRRLFRHDCSSLGGCSGSCVVDLESNLVIGLHFGGRYLQGNDAVALWQLTNDRLLKKAQVNFAQ